MRNDKWLMNCSYNPHGSLISNHLDALSKYFDLYSSIHQKVITLDDFNADIEEKHIKCFGNNNTLIRQTICYKIPDSPTCIDLLSTNVP